MKTVMKNTFMYDQQYFMAICMAICMIMINTGLSYRINKFDYADNITRAFMGCQFQWEICFQQITRQRFNHNMKAC